MIGKLTGRIDSVADNTLILDVGGVGYVVFCSAHTLRQQPGVGEAAQLLIETHVREDHIHLYGFASVLEREWFITLNGVNGVGTRMALAILSVLTPSQLMTAIAAQDKAALTQISGVGPKLADRLLTELKNKANTVVPIEEGVAGKAVAEAGEDGAVADAVSALTHLGYNRSDAYTTIQKIARQHSGGTVEVLIRESLKELAS